MSDNIRLERIQVTNLFGRFNYDINLNNGSDVAILIAPNGCGKTTIFKLLCYALNPTLDSFNALDSAPFDTFACTFSNGERIEYERRQKENSFDEDAKALEEEAKMNAEMNEHDKLVLAYLRGENVDIKNIIGCSAGSYASEENDVPDYEKLRWFHTRIRLDNVKLFLHFFDANNNHAEIDLYRLMRKFDDRYPDELEYINQVIEKIADLEGDEVRAHLPSSKFISKFGKEIGEIVSIRRKIKKIDVKLISSNREYYENKVMHRNEEFFSPTNRIKSSLDGLGVEPFNEETKVINSLEKMQDDLRQLYKSIDEVYQRRIRNTRESLPEIFLARHKRKAVTFEEFRKTWNTYIDRLVKYYDIGLVDDMPLKIPVDSVDKLEELFEDSGEFLTVYLEAFKDTITPWEPLYVKLNTLAEIINKRNAVTGKTLKISKSGGLYFLVGNKYMSIEKLSSGEKNDLLMFYKLIFNARKGDLVLIDEPEISWHIEWQEEFLDLLLKICEMNGIQAIVATHSPNIVNGHFELYAERNLTYGCAENK